MGAQRCFYKKLFRFKTIRMSFEMGASIIPRGLVVRIPRSHRGGRGSIPRTGIIFIRFKHQINHQMYWTTKRQSK